MIEFLLWLILLVLCWPLALLALVLYPLEPIRKWGSAAREAPGEQGKTADRRKGGALSREANAVLRSPPPAPGGTGLAGRLALSARSSDGRRIGLRSLPRHASRPTSVATLSYLRIGS